MKSAQIKVGQRLRFWLTNESEVFCLPVHSVKNGGQVTFVLEWATRSDPPKQPVYFTVDRSHILGRA